MIEIYGKPNCPYCVMAKNLCETRMFPFEYKELGTDYTKEELLEMFPGARTVPQIKVHGKVVGGYQEFNTYIEDTGYNGTGESL